MMTNSELHSLLSFFLMHAIREHSSNLLITNVQGEFYLLVAIYIRAISIFVCINSAELGSKTFTKPNKTVRI